MDKSLRKIADEIINQSINAVLPDEAVKRALNNRNFVGRLILVSIGKAGWQMAKSAHDILGECIEKGIVITKYGHVKGEIPNIICCEAGHPVPDENSFEGTEKAIELVDNLTSDDTVLFLISGGGSALFEKPLVPYEELKSITEQLLSCGASITEINTIRKRLSAVKGGKFAEICKPAKVFSIVLSDILGDPMDMIASGPAVPDTSTSHEAIEIIRRYNISLSDKAEELLKKETPKAIDNIETIITGSVKELCKAAANACKKAGYEPFILTDMLSCEAREAGSFLASIVKTHANSDKNIAFIAGGETIVHLKGRGMGGRNQELALSSAEGISNIIGTAIFSVGSDGTDGPTDAAGGYVDYTTAEELKNHGIDIYSVLEENDAYHALEKSGGLIITGATGTNVNDVAIALITSDEIKIQ